MLAGGMTTRCTRSSSARSPSAAGAFARRHPGVAADAGGARILRSVLMKPESQTYAAQLHARVEELAG